MPWMPEQPKREKQTRKARWHGYGTTRWRKMRARLLALHPLCVECTGIATVLDHITSVRDGGDAWAESNLQSLCESCHNSKSGRESHAPRTYGPQRRQRG
jgi:5-methylcytosine-specific restriction endonuclease McrA